MMNSHTLLPPSCARLADTLGWSATLKLMKCYPGMRLYIPVNLSQDHILVKQLGEDIAKKLVQLSAREWIFIPKGRAHMIACRNAQIVTEYTAGVKVPDLVRRYELSDRQIYTILNEPTLFDTQLSLL